MSSKDSTSPEKDTVESTDTSVANTDSPTSSSSSPSFYENITTKIQTLVSTNTSMINRQVFKAKVKEAVDSTNELLGTLEQKYHWLNSRLEPIVIQGKDLGQQTLILYEHRQQYGPQMIGGSVITTALFTGLKTRGRIFPTVLVSGLMGGLVSMGIYGIPPIFDMNNNPYRIFRKRND